MTGVQTCALPISALWRIESYIRFIDATHVIVDTYQTGINTSAALNATVVPVRTASIAVTTNATESLIITTTQSLALTSFNVDTFLIEQLN